MFKFFKMWNTLGKIGIIGGLLGGGIGAACGVAAVWWTNGPFWGMGMMVLMIGVLLGVYLLVRKVFSSALERQRLLVEGVQGSAKILEIRDTGVSMQNGLYYLVKFTLEVTLENEPPYVVKTKSMISRLTISQFQPGNTVPVMVDPSDKNIVALIEQTS